MNNIEKILHKKSKGRTRQLAIEQGAYDGRFRPRVVSNKKKAEHLKLRREKVQW